MAKKRKTLLPSLIAGHLGGIKRALLEGERRPAFLQFLDDELQAKRGIYALYDRRGRSHYTGKAADLATRLNQHLRDKHGDSWDRMTLFLVADSANVAELEGLVVATARPPGNKQKPKIGQDLRKQLRRFLQRDAQLQIDHAVYPERPRTRDVLLRRITPKKLKAVGQGRLCTCPWCLTTTRQSVLLTNGAMRKYIIDAGKRDAVLLLLQKTKRR